MTETEPRAGTLRTPRSWKAVRISPAPGPSASTQCTENPRLQGRRSRATCRVANEGFVMTSVRVAVDPNCREQMGVALALCMSCPPTSLLQEQSVSPSVQPIQCLTWTLPKDTTVGDGWRNVRVGSSRTWRGGAPALRCWARLVNASLADAKAPAWPFSNAAVSAGSSAASMPRGCPSARPLAPERASWARDSRPADCSAAHGAPPRPFCETLISARPSDTWAPAWPSQSTSLGRSEGGCLSLAMMCTILVCA